MAKKNIEISVEEKLRTLYDLQYIDSRLDEIRSTRGELPIEVEDLENEIEGLNKRISKLETDIEDFNKEINTKKEVINHSQTLIEKYKTQQDNVKNNKEFEALSKEMEFQELEIQLAEKKIREFEAKISQKNEVLSQNKEKIEEQIKAKEEQIAKKEKGEEKEPSPEQNEPQPDRESGAEQEDWNKRADELEMQHEKELEDLKDQQSKLEANFQKSIDNLMNSDGINNIITALQEMDRSLEMMLKQGKEESIAKDRQRQEKLDLAFDSPKFKEAVGDLVKDVYAQRKKVKGGFKEMENERANYAKLQTTYEKETKKGLDVKGYEKLKKMMGDIEKETPNFKDSYPKFYQKVNDTLAQTKDKILNKAKGQENENDRGRSL